MTKIENLVKRIDIAISDVENEVIEVEQGIKKKNIEQLKSILNQLLMMKDNTLENVSYSRLIIDSWSYSDPLGLEGLELIDIAKQYNKVHK